MFQVFSSGQKPALRAFQVLFECIFDNPTDETDEWGSGFFDQMCVASFDTTSRSKLPVPSCLDQSAEYGCHDANCAYQANCPDRTSTSTPGTGNPCGTQFLGTELMAVDTV